MTVKVILKKVIREFFKTLIIFHGAETKKVTTFDDSFTELDNYYPFKSYLLKDRVNKVEKYNYDLSIIIPIFNASNYLKDCVDSLINQITDFSYEIICVDDGSTDDSLNILENYCDSKLKIIHQENGGISSARNKGLNLSTGKYVGFVDNDDYVSEHYVETLMKAAINNQADYVKCGFVVFDSVNKKEIEKSNYPDAVMNDFYLFEENCDVWLKGYMWGGCYRREIWEGFCFPERYWYEDMVKNIYLYGKCKSLVSIKECLYYKRKHNSNAAETLWKKENKQCLDQLYLALNLSKMNDKNIATYCAQLCELGEYLYKRTKYLPEVIRRDAFIVACNIMQNESDIDVSNTNFKLKQIQKALISNDYVLWNLIGKYCCY